MKYFCTIEEAVREIKKGQMLILVDNPQRENEGDFYIPAGRVITKHITTMICFGGGLICAAITSTQAARLRLPLMVAPEENQENTRVNFTVSVNARNGISTGVSADDRTRTIKVMTNPQSGPADLVKPGHVPGLISRDGGVLERAGHTEAAVDLARLSNLNPAGVLCEIVGSDGKMAKLPDLVKLARQLNIKVVSIDDLKKYLKKNPLPKQKVASSVVKIAGSSLPTEHGQFQIIVYISILDNREHVVLQSAKKTEPSPMVRIHSRCLTGDTFFSLKCDCKEQLHQSMKLIGKQGGVILYLNQEGRGIGLAAKINAYSLQEEGVDTVEANLHLGLPVDVRDYQAAAWILKDLGLNRIILLTNNPQKEMALQKCGIAIEKTIPLETEPNTINKSYLQAKKHKLGHRLTKV